MEGFTYIDGVVALVIILSALLAYGRGLVREIMAITGWIVASILGYAFAPRVEPLVREIPGLGGVVGESCDLSTIGAFFIVFTVALIIASFFTPLFSSLIRRSALGGLDQGLGFMFGVLRGLLLVAIAFFVYDTVITGQEFTVVDESRSAAVFGRFTGDIQDQDPQLALGWITEKYEALVSGCSAN